MFKWMDRVYVNARKKIFKNMDTGEILNLELQDDPDNISQDSETPITAHCLNLAQQELMDDLGKTYTGTNITAPTVAGYGRIKKLSGVVIDDVNLFDMNWLSTTVLPSTFTTLIKNKPITLEAGTYTFSNILDDGSKLNAQYMSVDYLNADGVTVFNSTVNGTFEVTEEQAKSVTGINLYYNAQGHVGKTIVEMKLQKGSVATIYSPYNCVAVEVISQNGNSKSSNICYVKDGLSENDYIYYTLGKVHRANGTVEDVLNCSDKIVQYADSTTVYNTDGAEIEVSLNNSEAISDINENLKNVEETKSNLKTIDIDVTTPSDNNWLKIIDASAYGIDVKKIKNISIRIETTYAYFLDQMYSRYYISGTGIYIAILLDDYLNKPAKITIFYED